MPIDSAPATPDDDPRLREEFYRILSAELRPFLEDSLIPESPGPRQNPRRPIAFDSPGFLLWTLAGLRLFWIGCPSFRQATHETRRVVTLVAHTRCRGNITHMAALLDSSRRAVRETLKQLGLHAPPKSTRVDEASE